MPHCPVFEPIARLPTKYLLGCEDNNSDSTLTRLPLGSDIFCRHHSAANELLAERPCGRDFFPSFCLDGVLSMGRQCDASPRIECVLCSEKLTPRVRLFPLPPATLAFSRVLRCRGEGARPCAPKKGQSRRCPNSKKRSHGNGLPRLHHQGQALGEGRHRGQDVSRKQDVQHFFFNPTLPFDNHSPLGACACVQF